MNNISTRLHLDKRIDTLNEYKQFEPNWEDKTVLVVEDVLSNFQLIEAYLAYTKVNIIHAVNGLQALEIVKNNPSINMVLMDIRLPLLDGLAASSQIRKTHPHLPIIAETAFAMPTDRDLCIEAGCNDFISKPFWKHQLLDVMAQYF